MRLSVITSAALVACQVCWPVIADEPAILTGTVTHVRDGDTIEVGTIPIRLIGVSAPELKERYGKASMQFVVELTRDKRVRCELNGDKTYDRFVGTCYLGDQDIGATVIGVGLALDCPKFSGGRYKSLEQEPARSQMKLPKYCE